MPASIDFKICTRDCKNLVFTESTGTYSPSNLTGWETPNEGVADATAASLKIYDQTNTLIATLDLFNDGLKDPDNTATTHTWPNASYSETAYNFYQGLISKTTLVPYSTDVISDGVYTFKYEVTTGTTTYTKIKNHFHYCNVECCVNNILAKVPDDSCCCDSAILAKALKVKTMFEALKHAAQCYRKERFQRLLNNLNAICLQNSCNC